MEILRRELTETLRHEATLYPVITLLGPRQAGKTTMLRKLAEKENIGRKYVSLDDLANYEPDENQGLNVPPKGKHLFGMVTVGDKGQIVIPAKARKIFEISSGDQLVVLGKEGEGLAMIKANDFLTLADMIKTQEASNGR